MFNPEIKNSGEEEGKLDKFKKEIAEIKQKETKGELSTIHLSETEYRKAVDVNELTEKDMEIWEKLKEGTLRTDEFREYRAEIPKDNQSRIDFAAFIANKLSIITLRKYREEERKKEKGK